MCIFNVNVNINIYIYICVCVCKPSICAIVRKTKTVILHEISLHNQDMETVTELNREAVVATLRKPGKTGGVGIERFLTKATAQRLYI